MLFSAPARAESEVLAILELRFEQVPPALTADVREALRDVMSSVGYTVISQSDTAEQLSGAGLPPGCTVGECLATVRSKTRARHVVVGGISSQGSSYDMILTLLETGGGTALAQVTDRCDVCNFKEVEAAVSKAAKRLHRKALVFLARHSVLQVTSTPPAAGVLIDGAAAGVTPLERVIEPGAHVLTIAAEGRPAVRRRLVLDAGRKQRLHVRLLPGLSDAPDVADTARRGSRTSWLRWSMLGAGLVLGGVGGGLMAIDGDETSDPRYVHDTRSAGITLVSVGAAAAVTATLLTILEAARHRDSSALTERSGPGVAAARGATGGR